MYIYQSDDSLMHFCWKDRGTGTVEDDLIIFPDDIEYKRVKQCTTGRVFILKFKSSTRKFFFWMQEPKADKDEEYTTKVNNLLNNPPTPGSGGGGGGLPPALAGLTDQLGDGQLQGLLGNLDQQQLLQLLSGYGGGLGGHGGLSSAGSSVSPPTAASPTPTRVQSSPGPRSTSSASSSGATTPRPATATPTVPPPAPSRPSQPPAARQAVQLSDLQNILSHMQVPTENAEQPRETVDLSTVLTSDSLMPLLADPEFREQLAPFLPAGEELPQSPTELSNTLRSPQFQQALGMFSSALQSGQLAPLMGQFGFNDDVMGAASRGDMVEFVRAVQESSRPSTANSTSTSDETSRPTTAGGEEETEDKDKDEDEAMSLD